MSYKIVLSCTSGVSSEVIAEKMRAAAEVGNKDVIIEEKAANEEALGSLSDVSVLLLSPQIGHMEADLKAKYPNTLVKVIDMRDYGVMDGDTILEKVLADLKAAEEAAKPAKKHIVLICSEGFSSGGIAKNMREAAVRMGKDVNLEIESIAAVVSELAKLPKVDVVLLAPNVVFMKEDFEKAIPEGTPVLAIEGLDYGTANGEAIITKAFAVMK